VIRRRIPTHILAGTGALALSICLAPAVQAQVAPPPDPLPGQLPPPETTTLATPDAAQQPSRVNVDSRAALEQRPCPFDGSDLRLTLNEVQFTRIDGSPLPPEIAEALSGLAIPKGDQSVRSICEIRDSANDALRRQGWIASVQVPPQEINTGTLRLNVVTAHIVETRVRGNAGPYEGVMRARIAELEALDPLNEHAAERILLLAGDIPGLDIQLSLRPAGTGPGQVIGELTINYRRFAILGNAQNYNSKLLGRETGYVRAEVYGLTGMGDTTYIGASTTADFQEQKILQVGHIAQLDRSGTTLGARFSYAWSRPDLKPLDYRTDTLIGGFDLIQPIVRSVNTNLRATGGFDYVDQLTKIGTGSGLVPLTTDKLRILYLGLQGDKRATRLDGSVAWSLRGGVEIRKGFDILGATKPGFSGGQIQSRVDGEADAFVARANLQATVGIGRFFNLVGEMQGQWANAPLLNYEEFSLGNLTIGRGYDPGANSGDRAVGLRGEAQVNLPISSKVNTQLFGFYDYVKIVNLDPGSIEADRQFRSIGGGLRLALPGKVLFEIAYAHPIDKALTIDKAPPPNRVLVSLSFRFRDGAR
jgi:hemolysin activation/secretion protein